MNFYENESVSLYLQGLESIENIDSEKQHISFLSHPSLGRILIINGEIQHIEAYQALYHELLVHLPAAFVPQVEKALILGGGSLFAAYETLKYPTIKTVLLCDYDHAVLDLMGRHYSHAKEVLHDKRFHYVESDGWEFVKQCSEKFDLVINDCFNLILASQKMLTSSFQLLSGLCTDNGVCADVIYRHIFDQQITADTLSCLKDKYNLALSLVIVPEYPGILHIETVWGKSNLITQNAHNPVNLFQQEIVDHSRCSPFQYYSPVNLPFYLYLPPYIKKRFNL